MSAKPASASSRVRLRPQNPFDLIRLLARSQSDPRKAVAELVQNSLDAGARQIEITWFNEKGLRALSIHDDGGGVFPELDRVEALRRIAHTIGHSHKLDLTPAQRREQLVLGRYGIGLIGFWSVGAFLEMRSRVGGERAHVLRLREDVSEGEVFPSRSRLIGEPQTFTEVTVLGIHEAAVNKVRPPRLQAYLANELRGQLLERDAVVTIHDRVARGRARKEFTVKPRPYLGRPIDAWRELEVPGFEAARVELYLVAEEERAGVVALACGGTTVLDDIAEIDGVDLPRAPWSGGRLEGVIDFPELHVSPGTRRGFTHDEPVAAFLAALAGLESQLEGLLAGEARRRSVERQEQVAQEIRRAFRSVARRLPEYEFFGVRGDRAAGHEQATAGEPLPGAETPPAGDATVGSDADAQAPPQRVTDDGVAQDSGDPAPSTPDGQPLEEEPLIDGLLFPPGPLARVELAPRSVRLPPLASRRLRARALDGDGRPCAGDVSFHWTIDGVGELQPDGASALYSAPEAPHPVHDTFVRVQATQDDVLVEASAPVLIVDPDTGKRVAGIPEPRAVSAPNEPWRSRVTSGRWEYNDAHRDYLEVADVEARRLRYLIHLFAKEVVLSNFGRPGDQEILERMVEVLTSLDSGGRR